jgi:hypothetical protein
MEGLTDRTAARLLGLQQALGVTPAAIEARQGLTSWLCTIWRGEPNFNAYQQLIGAMMAIPPEGKYIHQAYELSFLTGLYRMRLHLETTNGYYSQCS